MPPSAQPSVAVVGGGIYGWCAALWLAERGAGVTVYDPRAPGSAEQTSGGRSRLLRFEYGGDRLYPQLTLEALPVWSELERRSGIELYLPVGLLMIVPEGEDGAWERASLAASAEIGMACELLSAAEVARRWPAISTAGMAAAVHNHSGGLLHAAEAVRQVAALAAAAGVERRPLLVEAVDRGSLALAGASPARHDQVLVCTGAWTRRLLGRPAVTPTRQISIQLAAGPADVPAFGEGAPFSYYGTPAYPGAGFKVGLHVTGPEGDPDQPAERTATVAEIDRLRAYAGRRFPGCAGAEVLSADVCFYEMTASADPVVARLDERTVVCAGFSGHGFKFAPVVSAAAADLVLERPPSIPLDRFGLP